MKCLILVTFLYFSLPTHVYCTEPTDKISKALKQYIETSVIPVNLQDAIVELRSIKNKTYQDDQMCQTCRHVVDGVLQYRQSGVKRNLMLKLVKDLCISFSNWGNLMCNSLADTEIDAILYMIDNRKNLTAERVCSIYMQNRLCEDPDSYNWTINIPPEVENVTVKQIQNEAPPEKLLHLTDIHFDPLYEPGSDADCGKPLCCQSGKPKTAETTTGYWGDYHVCDMPWHSVLNLMDQINKTHEQIDSIIYTGDIISHTWITSKQENSKAIKQLFDEFKTRFPGKKIYPVLGNHEAHPCDYYSPLTAEGELSIQWLFDLVADEWSQWLPEDAQKTLKAGGFYTVLVKEGYRIIALNSNVCYVYNIWLVYDDVDPYGQLKWFVDTLAEAERNGEIVHILAHIPPGGIECWRKWQYQFNRIIKRFSKTIAAQFNGHTHMDELRVFFKDDKTEAVSVAYNGASFTTFVGFNPNYRIYDISPATHEVLNYDQWIYNLTAANEKSNQPPDWYKLYSFKEAYGVPTMGLHDMFELVQRMKNQNDKTLLKQYRRFLVRDSDAEMPKPCDDVCLDNLMCTIVSTEFEDAVQCVTKYQ